MPMHCKCVWGSLVILPEMFVHGVCWLSYCILQLAYVSHSPVVIVYDMHYISSKTNTLHNVGLLISNETKMEAATGCTLLSTLEGIYPT